MTAEEVKCETNFNQTVKRSTSGRFIVHLPFLHSPDNLGQSRDIALRRFFALERKLARNTDIKTQYIDFMEEYARLGHMKMISWSELPSSHYFLPHHCVLKPDSTTTKLRVVFDASAKSSSNISLNDILGTGPTIQDDLFAILLRFRLPRYVFTADIEKMYRQILVDEDDRKYQLIVWREDPSQSIKCYQLCTVTYGTTSAPYLATKCLQRLASQGAEKYPLGAKALSRDFYVDDVMTGADSLSETLEIQKQLSDLLRTAGFNLRKWCANHERLLENVPTKDQAMQLELSDNCEQHTKTLGLTWIPTADKFIIRTTNPREQRLTKRTVLSDIAQLFDPLGIMGPVTVTAKMFLQELWKLKLDWDAALPMNLHTTWTKYREGLASMADIKFARHIFGGKRPQSIQIHAFSDASEKAYGAAIYLRAAHTDGTITMNLLCAKSRVAPTKTITLPRLELCAAKLAAELMHRVKGDLNMHDQECFFWTDSEIVLAWLNSESSSFHTFVANRIAAIQQLTNTHLWRHVRSKENPADLVSRGVPPEKFPNCHLWFYGPMFLYGPQEGWPGKYNKKTTNLEMKASHAVLATTKDTEHFMYTIDHQNSFPRLQRIIAYVLRFIRNIQRPQDRHANNTYLTVMELEDALTVIIKQIQSEGFKTDMNQLLQTNQLSNSSPLISLTPFLDNKGIMRVGGRLEASNLAYDAKHPILLPAAHFITKLLMTHLHVTNLHAGPQTLLAITRQRYWPIKGKTIARSVVQGCLQCTRAKPKLLSQIMGNLPATRVQPARPFINTGVDFCGPLFVHFKIRGKQPQKVYVAIFCCFATKATHLEIVSNLTSDAFINSLKRFMGRRGNCKNLYCDNATNFVGAKNELSELKEIIHSTDAQDKITRFSSQKGINFHFIPPRAPHFGGLWEAAVKSAKHLFVRSVGSTTLTYEELETVMVEIEAVLNSRPITPLSSNPNDLTALTPGHFLIGEPLTSAIDEQAEPLKSSLTKRWKLISHLKNEFWQRWSKEYLNELQHRHKWKQQCGNVLPGTMVVVKEDNSPPLKWHLGRVMRTIKGDDGLVRVVDVKTSTGVIRRPVHRLAPLPVEAEEQPENTNTDMVEEKDELKDDPKSTGDRNHQPSSNEDIPRKRMRQSYGSAIATLLLTCLIMPVIKGHSIETTQFPPQPGIHFEKVGTASIISTEWNLVVYYDMQPYWAEFETIRNGTFALDHLCKQIQAKASCSKLVTQFQHLQEELTKDNVLLMAKSATSRNKRGAVNVVGNVANALFGILDSEYATKMSETIENVRDNEHHLLNLIKNQTSLIDSTINILKKDQKAVEQKFSELDNQLTQINNRIRNVSEGIQQHRLEQIFTSLAIQVTLISSNFQRIQAAILNTIIDTHHGKINPLLLSPQQLRQELITIKSHLPKSLRLPINSDNLLQFYALMTVEYRIVNNHVIFRLRMPLVNLEVFDLLKLTPIPVLVNKTFVAIKPSSTFLAINLHRDQYYPLTEQQQAACTEVEGTNYLCKQLHPIYRRGSDVSSCEVGLLNHMINSPTCELMKLKTNPIWIQLFHPNQWIYAVKETTTVNIICDDEFSSMTLIGSGILKIQPTCIIQQGFLTIQGHHVYPSTTNTSFTRIGGIANITNPEQLAEVTQNLSHYYARLEELQTLQQQLLSQDLSDLPAKFQAHNTHYFTVGYLSLSLVIAIICGLLWKLRTKFYGSKAVQPEHKPTKPEPNPRMARNQDFSVTVT